MAKETGLGANFYVDGVDLSGDSGAMRRISMPMQVLPKTGLDKFAMERNPGQLDSYIDWQSWFNPAAGQAHPNLADPPRTDRIATYFHKGNVLGTPAANQIGKQLTYAPTRGEDGSLVINVDTAGNGNSLDWGYSLTTGKRTDTAATDGTGVDFGAANSFGLQAYLHVFSFTGTDVTIKLQESSDDGAGDAFADVTGGGFTQVTSAPLAEAIATGRALAVERYLRVVTTGTFDEVIFAVAVRVNRTSWVV